MNWLVRLFLSKGTGFFDPSYGLGPFDNDQNLIVSPDGKALYAVNAGSKHDRGLFISRRAAACPRCHAHPMRCRGHTPISLGIHGNTLIAVDSAENPSEPSGTPPRLSVSEILPDGSLRPAPHAASLLPFGYQARPGARHQHVRRRLHSGAFPVAARSDRTCSFRSFPTCFPPPTWRRQ